VNMISNPCIDAFAGTPAEVQLLINQLIEQCPPLDITTIPTTTEPIDCPVRCTINEETDELQRQVAEMNERIIELERRLNEITAPPPTQSVKLINQEYLDNSI